MTDQIENEENKGQDKTQTARDMDAEITPEELAILDNATTVGSLDKTDNDGTLLDEATGNGGDDLDVPGSELDDDNENIGEEDEENNYYSESDNKD